MASDLERLSKRACCGDKESQYALENVAEQLLAEGKTSEGIAWLREATIAFRIAAGYNESHWREAAARAEALETYLELTRRWIETRSVLASLPRPDVPSLSWDEFAEALVRSRDKIPDILSFAREVLVEKGVEFFSPGGSLQRRLGVLLRLMVTGEKTTSEYAALLQDKQVRVALDLLADWASANLAPASGGHSETEWSHPPVRPEDSMDFARASAVAELVRTLRDEHAMTDDHFWRLHHRENLRERNEGIDAHLKHLGKTQTLQADHQQLARRFNECLEARRAGRSWDDAIAAALGKFPKR